MTMPETHGQELPVYARLPLTIREGEGVHVVADDGTRYLDLYGGHASASLGYRHPALLKTLNEQASELFFQTNAVHVASRQAACDALVQHTPPPLSHVFFANSGAEANENALRLAMRHTGRSRIVALEGGFHGRSAAAAACTWGHERWYGFPQTPMPVTFVAPDDVDALERAVDDDIAAVILEPVQGVAGARDLSVDFLRAARTTTRTRGALLLSDEVQCGLGRCGGISALTTLAGEEVVADLVTYGKGIAGGFPAAALLSTSAIAHGVSTGDLGTTFGGGPMACALIATVLNELTAPGVLERVREVSAYARDTLCIGPVTSIQGAGLLLGLRTTPPARAVLAALRDHGILAGGAADPHVVRLMPPLTLTTEHVDTLRDVLAALSSSTLEASA